MFGLSLGDSDGHIVETIGRNLELSGLYVGLYGDPESENCLAVRQAVARIAKTRINETARLKRGKDLEIHIYDARTTPVWEPVT
jgi:hypothetical protein